MCQVAEARVWPLLQKVVDNQVLTMQELQQLSTLAPSLHAFLEGHPVPYGPYADVTVALVRHILQRAQQAYQPGQVPVRAPPQVKKGARDDRVMVRPGDDAAAGGWSHEESMLRTGVWSGVGVASGTEAGWESTQLGGSHVQRPLRKYLADHASQGTQPSCTKHKEAKRNLLPGMVLGWCHKCKRCLFMAVMANAESPRIVFELVYTMFHSAPRSIVYDNACNLLQYVLNREPEFFKECRFLVDAMHYKEHKHCGPDFDSSLYADITNSPLAEQKTSVLRQLENVASYMRQDTFMYFMRHWLHRVQALRSASTATSASGQGPLRRCVCRCWSY
jgi:hypothetical protein